MNTAKVAVQDRDDATARMAKILQRAHNALVEAVEERHHDPYAFVASQVFGWPTPTEEQRRFAKQLCYRLMFEPMERISFSVVAGGLEGKDLGDLELQVAASMARQTCAA